MVLPFVRELLADLEHSEAFERVRRHLSGGTGRRRVSGLTFTARALYLPFFVRAANAPSVIIVADNKAAEALHAAVLRACELTGALPAETLLVLDGTTGQNALSQAKLFNEATQLTGVIVTKLDSTAKGGVLVGIVDQLTVPIKYIGLGETADALQPFNPDDFTKALFEPAA